METPICDFVKKYADSSPARLHMPGHKGKEFFGSESLDITEIEGADVLYDAHGIIRKSENNAASLFGTGRTVYSTEGSSLCIRAMLFCACAGRKNPVLVAGRNVHKSFISAVALIGADVTWIYPDENETVISCKITPEKLKNTLRELKEKPCAVYITSPDYLGNVADVEGLARVSHSFGVPLLVDNAHGAYLKFFSRHPIEEGADVCCDSAHKTLPVLTGGAYLHISKNAPEHFAEGAEGAMALFASTSPSYLILQSLDKANVYIDELGERAKNTAKTVDDIKKRLKKHGFESVGSEPYKITLATKALGYTGREIAAILRKKGIETEFSDEDFLVAMVTTETEREDAERFCLELCALPPRRALPARPPAVRRCEKVLSVREAVFAESEELPVDECLGRTLADACISCPPAVPVLVSGEKIDREAIESLRYYGFTRLRTVK